MKFFKFFLLLIEDRQLKDHLNVSFSRR